MTFRYGKPSDLDPQRLVIARHLAAHGPTAGDELSEAIGLPPDRFWRLINHPWFEITGKGWGLTPLGRAAVSD